MYPFVVLPVSPHRVSDRSAEVARLAKGRGSGWCRALSDVRGRHRFLNVDLNGSCGLRAPWGVLFLSVDGKAE